MQQVLSMEPKVQSEQHSQHPHGPVSNKERAAAILYQKHEKVAKEAKQLQPSALSLKSFEQE